MKIRCLHYIIAMLFAPHVYADMTGMFGMMGMGGMTGMTSMGMMPNPPIVELIAGNLRNTRGWYEQRSNGQLILYPIFPLQPIVPMATPGMTGMSGMNLSMAAAASMSMPQSFVFIASQGWYTVDINGILTLHPTSAAISHSPPNLRALEDMTTGSMGGMMGSPP